MTQLVAAITIELETFASQTAVFSIVADDLDDTHKAAEEWYTFIMQVDQQVMVWEPFPALIQYDRHLIGILGVASAVWYEGRGRIMPQQLVQCFVGGGIWRTDDRTHPVLHRLVAQLASSPKLVS